ncbi:MAG: hypothetical protein ACREBU_16765, partial [Nitrososphaera sp.]
MTNTEPPSELELSLYENAIDSIKHAIEHYTQDPIEKRRYKYAILHLSQGVLLLLKERLRREHPNFVFTNVTDEGKTVDVEVAISRLERIAKVDLGLAKDSIQELASVRNRMEHYVINLSKQQADSIIGRVVPFLVAFTRDELHRDFPNEIGMETWQALLAIETYLTNAIRAAELRIREDKKVPFYCNRCQANTAVETSYGADEWSLNYILISCLVCLSDISIRAECRECKTEIIRNQGEPPSSDFRKMVDPIVSHYSYCSECKAKLHQEFPNIRVPTFVAEVRRWFQKHPTITTEQLYALLRNVLLAGPTSRYLYPEELY